jgi:hypothetical protein
VKALLCFAGAFVLSAAINTLLSACGMECECVPQPRTPEPQATLRIEEVSAYDANGNFATLTVDPTGGTVDLTAERLTIRYEHDGIQRGVIYEIQPHDDFP